MPKVPGKKKKRGDKLEDRVRRLLPNLEHENRLVRLETWEALAYIFQTADGTISKLLSRKLVKIQYAEKDGSVWDSACRTIPLVLLATEGGARGSRRRGFVGSLGEWLWSDFHGRSRVMRVADPGRFRRDEDAVITIARSLPLAEFPHTEFVCIDPGGFLPALEDLEEMQAICFVGRLSLYGEEAVSGWDDASPRPRYRFGMDFRPDGLPRGSLHSEYHCVVETADGPEGERRYVTSESDGARTDYGLIRRYVSSWSDRCRVIVHVAGSSSLGTQAAAHFAAHMLFRPGLNRKLLPAPPKITPKSHLEALVRVTADTEGSEFGWKLRKLKVLDLCVDDWKWSENQYRWQSTSREAITVWFSDAPARQQYRGRGSDAAISLRSRKVAFRPPSENYLLCLALLMLAAEQGGTVTLAQLGRETWIWKDGKAKTAAHVRARLSHAHVQQEIGESFVIENDTCRLIARVRIEVGGAGPKKPR